MEEFDEVKLGDIVIFRTVKLETFVSKNIRTIPPPMVVIDIEKEIINKPMTSTKDFEKQSKIKVHCIWFSHYLNRYEKKWIFMDLLYKFDYKKVEQNLEIGNTVCLRSINYMNKLKDEINNDKNNYFIAVTTFLPPKMIITGIEQTPKKELKPFYDNITGELKRNSSLVRIKCMWHDGSTGKYKEDWFIKEALILADALPQIIDGQDEAINALNIIIPED